MHTYICVYIQRHTHIFISHNSFVNYYYEYSYMHALVKMQNLHSLQITDSYMYLLSMTLRIQSYPGGRCDSEALWRT